MENRAYTCDFCGEKISGVVALPKDWQAVQISVGTLHSQIRIVWSGHACAKCGDNVAEKMVAVTAKIRDGNLEMFGE